MRRILHSKWEQLYPWSIELGKGQQATVYQIYNFRHGKAVARKVLKRCDDKAQTDMMEEVRLQRIAAKKGLAPEVVHFHKKRCVLDMQPLGKSLKQMITDEGGRISEDHQRDVVRLIKKLVDAGIDHPDLHAENILLSDGHFAAIDFAGVTQLSQPALRKLSAEAKNFKKATHLLMLLYDDKEPAPFGLIATGVLKEKPEILIDKLDEWGMAGPRKYDFWKAESTRKRKR